MYYLNHDVSVQYSPIWIRIQWGGLLIRLQMLNNNFQMHSLVSTVILFCFHLMFRRGRGGV